MTTATQTAGEFRIASDFRPTGDQPQAIDRVVEGIEKGMRHQTLMGVTGSGKTFTMACAAERIQRPTLVIAHNKTLAAQLATEFKEFLPDNAVEYFVSYYDYYQPEAYLPRTDTYIEKDADVNEELDKLRHSATRALLTRRDVLIVASVSCIFGLGSPEEYQSFVSYVRKGETRSRNRLVRELVNMQYERNDLDLARGRFRVRGDTLEILPAYEEIGVRIEYWGDEVERIVLLDPLTGEILGDRDEIEIYPAKHFVTSEEKLLAAIETIQEELAGQLAILKTEGKLLEAQRLESRTNYDIEMMRETGYCAGVENYSRHLSGALPWHLALHPARLLPRGLPPLRRRVPHDPSADQGDVLRGQVAQGGARRLRLPPALSPRQPAPRLPGVRGACQPGRLRLRHAGPLREPAQSAGRGAGHQARPASSTRWWR